MSKLMVSFSGGRTSAYMSRWLQINKSSEFELRFIFANTGQEHPNTLEFVDRCDREWGLCVEWIEAAVSDERGTGTAARVVGYETASRNGSPFVDVVKKYGIPNQAYPHCTRELKLQPMRAHAKATGWGDCSWAVGIRADEFDRMAADAQKSRVIYPLIKWAPITKPEVVDWWSRQSFDLNVPERLGNCMWCWKKSLRKHLTNITESPEVYDFPEALEGQYGLAGHNVDGTERVFFRGNRSTAELRRLARQPFVPFSESHQFQQRLFDAIDELDESGGCSESCEVFAA